VLVFLLERGHLAWFAVLVNQATFDACLPGTAVAQVNEANMVRLNEFLQ
jgi:hypothetical protein